jgi:hypothetical protein
MRLSSLVAAVAAALFSFGAVAGGDKSAEDKNMKQQPQAQTDKKSEGSASAGGSASSGASADKKAEGSAAAGGSASTEAKTEGHSASGGVTSSERTAEPKSDKKY